MLLTNLPVYELGEVHLPDLWPGVTLTWLENGDVEIVGATAEQVQAVKRAIYIAAGVDFLAEVKAAALAHLNEWRGAQRTAMGLTTAAFQELVYSGKMMQAQRWLDNQALPFPFGYEATARGISHQAMVELIVNQGAGWMAASDLIEGNYILARAAIEAAEDEAAIVAVLVGLA